MRILHITESLGAGVASFLYLVTRSQIATGHEVILAHSVRPETVINQLDSQFSFLTKRIVVPMVTPLTFVKDFLSVWQLLKLIRATKPDIIHLHSSKAGALGRIAAWLLGCSNKVFYSPHGFSFLRQDVHEFKRYIFLKLERIAAKLGGTLIACSMSEMTLAVRRVAHPRVKLVENATDLNEISASKGGADGVVNVLNAGRVCYQKAPWRFAKVANACLDLSANFLWVGEGDLVTTLIEGSPQNLKLTGWVTRNEVSKHLGMADIFLMPSLWEGMPMALIEAQAAGVPAVVSNSLGCDDVVEDGVTGFICSTDEDLCLRTRQLIIDTSLRKRMGANAAKMAGIRFSVNRMNDELQSHYLKIYER